MLRHKCSQILYSLPGRRHRNNILNKQTSHLPKAPSIRLPTCRTPEKNAGFGLDRPYTRIMRPKPPFFRGCHTTATSHIRKKPANTGTIFHDTNDNAAPHHATRTPITRRNDRCEIKIPERKIYRLRCAGIRHTGTGSIL